MRLKVLSTLIFLAISSLMFFPTVGESFDLEAHSRISLRAVDNSSLDNFLKDHLTFGTTGFPMGVAEVINGRRVDQWLAQGSQDEDSPPLRVQEHFHNPLLPWNQAGLGGLSSVIWAQERNQDDGLGGGNHSWHDARDSYFRAFTGTSKGERDKAWAETFESLGHIVHLIQDAATPSHTRSDPHICCLLGIGDPDGFHVWAEREDSLAKISAMGSQPFDPSILELSQDPLAPVPIARIMDTDKYGGTNPDITAGTAIGIAEYSNANFFSDDRLFSTFPFPSESSVQLGAPEPEPENLELRRYFYKVADGDTDYRLAVPSALYESLELALQDQEIGLDDKVLEDYAVKLLPRAIGYSAGLIDYFFRGEIEWEQRDDLGLPPSEFCDPANLVCLKVRNVTLDEDTAGPGEMIAVVFCCDRGDEGILVSQSVPLTLTRDWQEVNFTLNSVPSPGTGAQAKRGELFLIYRGPLGNEQAAVMTGNSCPNGAVSFQTQFNFSFFACDF